MRLKLFCRSWLRWSFFLPAGLLLAVFLTPGAYAANTTLSPQAGAPGTVVNVYSSGWTQADTALDIISVTVYAGSGLSVNQVPIILGANSGTDDNCGQNSTNNYPSCSFMVPSGFAPGTVVTVAVYGVDTVANSSFTIVSPSLNANPNSSSAPGQTVILQGSGFASGDTTLGITMSAFNVSTVTITPEPGCAISGGSFNCTFQAPLLRVSSDGPLCTSFLSPGNYTLTGTGTLGDTATAQYTVNPGVTLSPNSGPVGTQVTAVAAGLCIDATVSVSQNGSGISSNCTKGGDSAACTFTIGSQNPGTALITLTGNTGDNLSAGFTVVTAGTVTANPADAPPGTMVTVSAGGFPNTDTSVQVSLLGTGTNISCPLSGGSFSCQLSVPNVAEGLYSIEATGSPSGDYGIGGFTVDGTASINIFPSSGEPGEYIAISGTTNSSGLITFTLKSTPSTSFGSYEFISDILPVQTCDASNGTFSCGFFAPNFDTGLYNIIVNDSSLESVAPLAIVPFTITQGLVLTPNSGRAQTQVNVMGTGFFGDTSVTVTFGQGFPPLPSFINLPEATCAVVNPSIEVYNISNCTFTAPTFLTGPVPLLVPGSYIVQAQGNNSLIKQTNYFVYPNCPDGTASPTCLTISPTSGPPGTVVTMSGLGFGAENTLGTPIIGESTPSFPFTTCPIAANGTFSGCSLTIPEIPPSQITIAVAGNSPQTFNGGVEETAAGTFTVTAPPPPLLDLSPQSGPPGTVITITAAGSIGFTVLEPILMTLGGNAPGQGPQIGNCVVGVANGPLEGVINSGNNTIGGPCTATIPAGTATGNYTIWANDFPTVAAANFTVVPPSQSITFPALPSPVTYGVSPITLGATASSTLPVSYLYSGPATLSGSTLTITGAGTVIITATQTGGTTFTPAPLMQQTILVNPAPLTIGANSTGRPYGQINPTFTGSVVGAVNGDILTESFSTLATLSSPVGGYSIVPAVSGANLASYTVTPVNGSLTVTQAGLTAMANSTSKVYGAANPALTGSVIGAVNGDMFTETFSTPATPSSPVGGYAIMPAVSGVNLADYMVATVNGNLQVTPAALTATANNASKVYGTANPTFTGNVSGQLNDDTFSESFTTPATLNSPVGNYAIMPGVTGSDVADYTLTPVNGTLMITQAGSSTKLTSSNTDANENAQVTFTATVASATTGTPTGSVQFLDGVTPLGNPVTMNGQGLATLAVSNLAAGSDTIAATYLGDQNFRGSSSNDVNQIIVPPDFTITANPTTINVDRFNPGKATLTVTPSGGFNGLVTFACNGQGVVVCAFLPPTITSGGSTVLTVSDLSATGPSGPSSFPAAAPLPGILAGVFAAILLLASIFIGGGGRRSRARLALAGASLCLLMACIAGCAKTTELVTVNVTASGSGNLSQQVEITVEVSK